MRISDWSSDVCSSDLLDCCTSQVAQFVLSVAMRNVDRQIAHRNIADAVVNAMKFCADDRLEPAGEHHGDQTGDADNQQGDAHDCIGQSALLFVERLGLDDHWGAKPLDAGGNLVTRLPSS